MFKIAFWLKALVPTLRLSFALSVLIASVAVSESLPPAGQKIGVLLVNHGSRSESWRQALLDVEKNVRPVLMGHSPVQGIQTAFMEYTEPSIATRLREFDEQGFTDVVIVPIFLTVSPHTFDDIPTIVGKKADPQSVEGLKIEGIARYTPKAKIVLAPNLDYPGLLKDNVLRRVKNLSQTPNEEGLVLIAYGDETYEKEWTALLKGVGDYVRQSIGIDSCSVGWCGHVAHYDPGKTTQAVEEVLKSKKRAVVIPVLVSQDENFQIKIIGGGIARVPDNSSRVAYRPDSILPDPNVDQWVIRIASRCASEITGGQPLASDQRP